MEHLTLLVHDQLMAERRAEARRHALALQARRAGVPAAVRTRTVGRVLARLRLAPRAARPAETSP